MESIRINFILHFVKKYDISAVKITNLLISHVKITFYSSLIDSFFDLFLILDIVDFITSLVKKGTPREEGNYSAMGEITLNIFVKNTHKRNRFFFWSRENKFLCSFVK